MWMITWTRGLKFKVGSRYFWGCMENIELALRNGKLVSIRTKNSPGGGIHFWDKSCHWPYIQGKLIQKDRCTPMFIAALFTVAKTWKQSKCPSTDEWIKKMWYIYMQWNITQNISDIEFKMIVLENSMELPLKTKNRATIWSSNSTARHISRKDKNSNLKRDISPKKTYRWPIGTWKDAQHR